MIELGDMIVHGRWPGKMMKALAVIAAHAHQSYDASSGMPPGTSRDLCLFMSLAVRDFLVQIGYRDATVRGCALYARADDRDGKEIWSMGLGMHGLPNEPEKFNGHAVCTVPSLGLFIDVTTYQAIRPHWSGVLTGMTAATYDDPPRPELVFGRHPFAGGLIELSDRNVIVVWLDRPELQWRKTDDFRVRNSRRIAVTKALVNAFGGWRDG